jgi:hypothetical protein
MKFPKPFTQYQTLEERYHSYFRALRDELREHHQWRTSRNPKRGNSYALPSGYSAFRYRVWFSEGTQEVGTALQIQGKPHAECQELFDALKEQKAEIESCFGSPLQWERKDQKRQTIAVYRNGDIWAFEGELEEIADWHIEKLPKLREVFTPKMKQVLKQ